MGISQICQGDQHKKSKTLVPKGRISEERRAGLPADFDFENEKQSKFGGSSSIGKEEKGEEKKEKSPS